MLSKTTIAPADITPPIARQAARTAREGHTRCDAVIAMRNSRTAGLA